MGVVQLVVTPKGYISSTTRDCCDICIWFNALKVTRVTLIRAAILDLITFSRTKSLILTPEMYDGQPSHF